MLRTTVTGQAQVQTGLRAFAKHAGVPVRFAAIDQLRLWAEDLIRLGPPRKSTHGKGAVTEDVAHAFVFIDQAPVLAFFHRLSAAGILPTSVAINQDGSQDEIDRYHEARRRNGRVKRYSRVVHRHGSLAFLNEQYLPRRAFRKHIRETHRQVGHMKQGFAIGLQQVAAAVGKTPKVPAWVRKAPRAPSTASLYTMSRGGHGSVSLTNHVPYAARKFGRLPEITARTRERRMAGVLRRPFTELAERFNRGQLT
jgi:hypothetical protein